MLSICIPIYNYNVSKLVEELQKQALTSGVLYEILLVDDGSVRFLEENRKLQRFPNVVYIELKENIGRAKIRNFLAKTAKYPYLIFMDCDVKIIDSQFVEKYVNTLPADVLIGGCTYYPTPPAEKEYRLRWVYGTHREARSAVERSKNIYKSFSTFNFLIKKDIFQKIKFNEKISGYGHEDTLFGWELKKQNIAIKHIENPLIHQISDTSPIFLQKTENSVQNLYLLYQKIPEKKGFAEDNHLLKTYIFLKKYCLTLFISLFFGLFGKCLYKNLCSEKPKMLFFDLYKLGILNKFANSY